MRRKKKKVSTVVPKEAKIIADYCDEAIGQITIQTIRDLNMCEIVMETDDKTFNWVAKLGKELISNDRQELFGYAVKKAIVEAVEEKKRLEKTS
jgi:hypothetical protein